MPAFGVVRRAPSADRLRRGAPRLCGLPSGEDRWGGDLGTGRPAPPPPPPC